MMLYDRVPAPVPFVPVRRGARRALVLALLSSFAAAQSPMTPGNLIAVRVGDGVTALTAAAAPVFLDEYSPAGALVQTFSLPTTASGNQHACTQAGTATTEGSISRTVDGRYFLVTGYAAAPGTLNVAQTTSAAVKRVVARIGLDGTIDTSTALDDAYSGGALTSAASVDGSEFWMAGSHAVTAAGSGGVRHAPFGATTSTQTCSTVPSPRTVVIAGESLLASSTSATSPGIYTIGGLISSVPNQGSALISAGQIGAQGGGPGDVDPNDSLPCTGPSMGCSFYNEIDYVACVGRAMMKCPGSPPVVCRSWSIWCGPGPDPELGPWWDRLNGWNYYWGFGGIQRGQGGAQPSPWVNATNVDFRGLRGIHEVASWFAVGNGCAGSMAAPSLIPDIAPYLGRVSTFQMTNLPFGIAIFAIGTPIPAGIDLGMIGAPGCTMHTTLEITALVFGGGTAASFPLTIPNNAFLLGAEFAAQSAVLDPAANAFGWTVSNAIRATIGR